MREPRDISKLVAEWALARLAAVSEQQDPVRSYDRRYDCDEYTRERAITEAVQAAALARQYTDDQR